MARMAVDPERPLSKPLYESLPWLYALAGLFGLAVGYRLQEGWWSHLFSLAGIGGVTLGIVIGLRRRDYRARRAQYRQLNDNFDPDDRGSGDKLP
jgi:hypothetical protein